MILNFFTPSHLLTLAIGCLLVAALYILLKHLPDRLRLRVMFFLSLLGPISMIWDPLAHENWLRYLPFHLCSFNAAVIPIVVLTKNERLGNLLLLWCLGGAMALLLNGAEASWNPSSLDFWAFFVPHVFETCIPGFMFVFHYVKKRLKYIPGTILITGIAYTMVHLVNVLINRHLDQVQASYRVNYMFSVQPYNEFQEMLWKIIPHSYWYGYLYFPMVVVWLGVIYLPEIIRAIKKRFHKNAKEG